MKGFGISFPITSECLMIGDSEFSSILDDAAEDFVDILVEDFNPGEF